MSAARYYPVYVTDNQIRAAAEQNLRTDPSLDASQIRVTVQNSIAELHGSVNTWEAYSSAMNDVLRAGASRVSNRLRMRPDMSRR
jgi:osmotically-inducible protein OsmY